MYESYGHPIGLQHERGYSSFSKNDRLTPNDPRLIFDPITFKEGLKLMDMYESYGHAM